MPPSPLSKFRTFCPSYKKFWAISSTLPSLTPNSSSHSVPSVSVGLSERPGSVVLLSHPSFPQERGVWTPPPNLSSGLSRNAVHSLGLVVSNGCDFLEPTVEMKPEDGASAARGESDAGPREALAEERTMLPRLAPAVPEDLELSPDSARRGPGGKRVL